MEQTHKKQSRIKALIGSKEEQARNSREDEMTIIVNKIIEQPRACHMWHLTVSTCRLLIDTLISRTRDVSNFFSNKK